MVTFAAMGARRIGGSLVLVGLIGASHTTPTAAPANAVDPPRTTVLNVRLTVSQELPGVSQTALMKETESIWRDAQVQLRWLKAEGTGSSDRPLRILVTRRAVSAADGHRWPVGELRRFEDSTAIAMASITAALRIVQERPELPLVDLSAMRQYKLGVVLGRAVAHEIGHYLLQSNTHSPYGLMRASIDAREFADLRTGAFRLDRESLAFLAARALAARGD